MADSHCQPPTVQNLAEGRTPQVLIRKVVREDEGFVSEIHTVPCPIDLIADSVVVVVEVDIVGNAVGVGVAELIGADVTGPVQGP